MKYFNQIVLIICITSVIIGLFAAWDQGVTKNNTDLTYPSTKIGEDLLKSPAIYRCAVEEVARERIDETYHPDYTHCTKIIDAKRELDIQKRTQELLKAGFGRHKRGASNRGEA